MQFLGVDLAWGFRKPSWVCVLTEEEGKYFWKEFFTFVTLREWETHLLSLPPGLVVAFDAPLRVTVEEGLRTAEKVLVPWLRQRGHGILPMNRTLARRFYPALFAFWESVERHFDCSLEFASQGRHALEVFPPLSVLGFFGREGLRLYKAGHFGALGELFRGDESPLSIENLPECLAACLSPTRGRKDRFDAFLCACTALFAYRWGRNALQTFGDEESFIVLPLWSGEL